MLRLAKVKGIVGADNPPSILATMSQSELDEVRRRIREMKAEAAKQDEPKVEPEQSAETVN